MYNFKKTETKETTGFSQQFITYGVNLLKINQIEAKPSAKGDKVQIKFHVEGPSMGKDFVGADLEGGGKAEGLVGKVNLGIYFDPTDENKISALMNNLMYIAEKAEIADAVQKIEADSLESLLEGYTKLIRNKFVWFIVKAEQYESNGKTGFALSFKEGKIGKDENDKDIYQVFAKHVNFKEAAEITDNIIYKVKGTNIVGSNAGKKDVLEFNPKYDLKMLGKADNDPDITNTDVSNMKDAF